MTNGRHHSNISKVFADVHRQIITRARNWLMFENIGISIPQMTTSRGCCFTVTFIEPPIKYIFSESLRNRRFRLLLDIRQEIKPFPNIAIISQKYVVSQIEFVSDQNRPLTLRGHVTNASLKAKHMNLTEWNLESLKRGWKGKKGLWNTTSELFQFDGQCGEYELNKLMEWLWAPLLSP